MSGFDQNEVFFRKNCFFVDLFVRVSNSVAVNMYRELGYVVYRRIVDYYTGECPEDAFGGFGGRGRVFRHEESVAARRGQEERRAAQAPGALQRD